MQPSTCAAVQPGCSVVSLRRMIAGRLAARRIAWYSGRPEATEAAFPPPVAARLLGSGAPEGPITFGSQS